MKIYKTLIIDDRMVRKLVNIKDTVGEVEKAFKDFGRGRTQMPAKIYLHLDEYNGDFRAMPAYIEGMKSCGIKWVNVHPDNRKRGIPTVMAMMILSDPSSGLPLCIMDATYITALRTGAAGAIAAKYLARKNSKRVGLVGCGVQAATQLAALSTIFKIKEVSVWSLKREDITKFKKIVSSKSHFKINARDTIRSCVEGSDIVVTTTPSRKPIVKSSWIKEGTHINAIGADAKGKEELEGALLKRAKVVVDSWEQASHSGEINVPLKKKIISKKSIYADIGEIVTGRKKGRTNPKEITVFDSTGLAIQDIAVANLIYRKAKRLKNVKSIRF